MQYPEYRPRRLRRTDNLRRLTRETRLSVDQLILPLFVLEGEKVRQEISSMPGQYQLSVDELVREAEQAAKLGIPGVLLFGIPGHKDPSGSDAVSDEGIVPRAVRALKRAVPELLCITDVCFCEYTDHGHCGWIDEAREVDNDRTLEMLGEQVLAHARAGADMVAPSGMMDGMVGYLRETLDEDGFESIPIMSYSAKYASAFYGPFRDAVGSAPRFGDRRAYQMDPANALEAMREVTLDVQEGADIVMVKPALAYLDIIRRVKDEFDLPVAAYNVSGEYSMIKAAARLGWLDEQRMMLETVLAIRRAGADIIITYWARDLARILH
ncbi:MAG: porphobilinogen synthase [Deltaproteobacteria bacterium]|nr:porphobilinogen synthase [Deltaproteobacteria bacterium]